MGLSVEGFISRLLEGKPIHCSYQSGRLEGLISAWRYQDQYIVTWEECPAGKQYDEPEYTRDERMEFHTPEDVLAFAQQAGYPPSQFGP